MAPRVAFDCNGCGALLPSKGLITMNLVMLCDVFSIRDQIHSRKVKRDGLHCGEEERSLGKSTLWGKFPPKDV